MCNLRGTIFYMKKNVLQDFHIYISALLRSKDSVKRLFHGCTPIYEEFIECALS